MGTDGSGARKRSAQPVRRDFFGKFGPYARESGPDLHRAAHWRDTRSSSGNRQKRSAIGAGYGRLQHQAANHGGSGAIFSGNAGQHGIPWRASHGGETAVRTLSSG